MHNQSNPKTSLSFQSKINNALFFSSIEDINEDIWQSLECERNFYFHRDFLNSIEKNHKKITFFYVVLLDKNGNPKSFSSIQIIDFYLETIKNDFEHLIRNFKKFGRKIGVLPKIKPLKLLICGNTFVSGEHGIFIKDNFDKKDTLKEIAKAIYSYTNHQNQIKFDVILLKDFANESLVITDELKKYQYHPFSVEPNMVLKLNNNWHQFEDYLAAMKTKFRVKAKKALQLSAAIRIENVTSENVAAQIPKMNELYLKVTDNASFNLSSFNLETYRNLTQSFGETYVLKTFWLEDKIVGFMSGIINEKSLDAHFVGLDYQYNKTHAIYQTMLYEYVKIAIDRKVSLINFGRTASEIKSSVGAIPQDLTIYLRHKKSITNRILKVFLQRVQPTPFHQKFPFKK